VTACGVGLILEQVKGSIVMGQSWSGIRKLLEEDLLCEALRGRVQYFITKYNNAHDESGRVAVRVDGVEVLKGNEFIYYRDYLPLENALKKELGVPRRAWNGRGFLNKEENEKVEELIKQQMLEQGDFSVWQFTDALQEYKNNPIKESLSSLNPIVRMFAILDRRVGKRTLQRLEQEMEQQPEWLRFFYQLRMSAE
jgi:hypothetical protein